MQKWKKVLLWSSIYYTLPVTGHCENFYVDEGQWKDVPASIHPSDVYISNGTPSATTVLSYDGDQYKSTVWLPNNPSVRTEHYSTTISSNGKIEEIIINSNEKRIEAGVEPNILTVNADIDSLVNKTDSRITITAGSHIKTLDNVAGYTVDVTNLGHTGNITNTHYINNTGELNGFQGATDVENAVNGVIKPLQNSETNTLLNNGMINLTDYDLTVKGEGGETFANGINGDIRTTAGGRLAILTAGEAETSNWGTIISKTDDEYGPLALGSRGGSTGTITLYNAGTIAGPQSAITIDGTRTGEGTRATIENHGYINGGITTANMTGDKTSVTIKNTTEGVWSGDFQDKEYETRFITNKFVLINNDGTIKTNGNEKNERGIIHSELTINGGSIDIRDGSLTLDGDYEGRTGGQIHTSGVLGGDETELPNLQITGKVTGEATLVTIDNLGGTGAATHDGIAVVRAKSVDGEGFTKKGRIVAGAYDYDLVRIEGGDYTEWRLTSEAT
ncbi:hypothetical protein AAN93_005151, partial [Salmonella enterica subsp. enterica]|nr:hypothetical protein [Salmonella enterica subsp. enterica serovar Amherstiana]